MKTGEEEAEICTRTFLTGKRIPAVDDEPDVLEILEEELDMCEVHKATSYETAIKNLRIYERDE